MYRLFQNIKTLTKDINDMNIVYSSFSHDNIITSIWEDQIPINLEKPPTIVLQEMKEEPEPIKEEEKEIIVDEIDEIQRQKKVIVENKEVPITENLITDNPIEKVVETIKIKPTSSSLVENAREVVKKRKYTKRNQKSSQESTLVSEPPEFGVEQKATIPDKDDLNKDKVSEERIQHHILEMD